MNDKKKFREALWLLIGLLSGWLIIDCYVNLWGVWKSFGLTLAVLDDLLYKVAPDIESSWQQRLFLLVFPVVIALCNDKFVEKEPLSRLLLRFVGGALLFIVCTLWTPSGYSGQIAYAIFYVITTIGGATLMISVAFRFTPYLYGRGLIDNKIEAEGFMQNTTCIKTPTSINFLYKFKFQGKEYKGWLNITNPFRAIKIEGGPGSGKSFVFIQEIHRQWVEKIGEGHIMPTFLMYDYKYPELTELSYGDYKKATRTYFKKLAPAGMPSFNLFTQYPKYYQWVTEYNARQEQKKCPQVPILPKIANINFNFPSQSCRCNPFKLINTEAGAGQVAEVMYVSLNRKAAENKGEFFTESAKALLKLNIWLLKLYKDGKYCTLPHALGFLSKDEREVFPIYELYSIFFPEIGTMFAPFKGAYDREAFEQLQGQLGSTRIGLSTLVDDMIKWVFTEDPADPSKNIELDVNNPAAPLMLCIGNDGGKNENKNIQDKKDTIYAAATSVLFACALPIINKKGKNPSLLSFDELPTVFIEGIDKMVATGRSNGVSVMIALQDGSQGIRDYGEKHWRALSNTIGNNMYGAMRGNPSKELSDSFGEKKVEKKTTSISTTGELSYSISEHREKKIPADEIENLSQGKFVGRVADNFGENVVYKDFYGQFDIDKKLKTKGKIPSLYSKKEIRKLPYIIKQNSKQIDADMDNIVLDTKNMCERLDTLKHNMKIYNRDVSVKADKEGNMPPTIDDVIHSFENKDLISMEAACVIFENIYWISSQIKVPMYEYVEGDDIIAKAEVLGVIDPLDETQEKTADLETIVLKMKQHADIQKAKDMLKYLCKSTELYMQMQNLMDQYFPTYDSTMQQAEKVRTMIGNLNKELEETRMTA